MRSRNTVRESSHIYFFCGRGPLLSSETAKEHTQHVCLGDSLVSLFTWETSRSLPFTWATSRSLPSVQNYRPYIVFQVPWTRLFTSRIFLFMAGYQNLHTSAFFPVICWSYLRTEISVTLSIDNKLYSLSFETTLLILSCDHIESAKFIVAS